MVTVAGQSQLTKLDAVSFDKLVRTVDPFASERSRFDLSGVRLVTPAALVQLAAACYALAEDGRQPVIVVDDVSVRTYLMRAGFIGVVEGVAEIEPAGLSSVSRLYAPLRGSNPMLIEVTKIQTGDELPALLDKIVSVL